MTPPSTIAHYRITSKLGEGGMGAVYRATDTKLNRDVAIKVLPAALAGDAQYMARFEREAQTLAALNHPNIATIYGVEQGAIVMELVEGADLKGPLPLDEVIAVARQIATGLEAAHEKGIIHRDLKPANIKLPPGGTVKILDFGLAKTTAEATAAQANPTISPTLSLAMTQAGMILGTAAYMSPEQARGKTVDKRADIWAFGVVLYELLTGKMLFGAGETVTDTLASVVKDKPNFDALPAGTPTHIRRLLDRCLRKDAATRLRDIGEARVILDEPVEAIAPAPARAARHIWVAWVVAGLALVSATVAWFRPTPPGAAGYTSRFLIPMPPGTVQTASRSATQWVPSPDGRNLAMIAEDAVSGATALWIRPLDATEPRRLDKTDGAVYPFWSPDSKSIAFFTQDKLKRVAASGGSVATICELNVSTGDRGIGGDGGAWSPDGVIVFSLTRGPLLQVPAAGGVPRPATALEKGELGHQWPQFLPGGRHVMYLASGGPPSTHAIYVQELDSTSRVRVIQNSTRAVWAPPGFLLFLRDGNLMAQRMDPKSFQVSGEPLGVADDVAFNAGNGRNTIAVSQNGVLAYRAQTDRMRQVTWRDREGKVLSEVGKPFELSGLSLSPDEKSAAFTVGQAGKYDVWTMDLASGATTRLTTDSRASSQGPSPKWSPDSLRLAFAVRGAGSREVSVASGKITPLGQESAVPEAWSPDGKSILCTDADGPRIYLRSMKDGKLETILETPQRMQMFSFSPDGKFVAYASLESGRNEVYVASFPSFAVRKKVSDGGGVLPTWTRGGRELLYVGAGSALMSAEIRTGTTLEASIPKPLFTIGPNDVRSYRFGVTADGQRILISGEPRTGVRDVPQISLVLNWLAELQK